MKNWKNENIKDCFDYWEGQMIDGKFGEKKGTSGFSFCREIISMFGERKLGFSLFLYQNYYILNISSYDLVDVHRVSCGLAFIIL